MVEPCDCGHYIGIYHDAAGCKRCNSCDKTLKDLIRQNSQDNKLAAPYKRWRKTVLSKMPVRDRKQFVYFIIPSILLTVSLLIAYYHFTTLYNNITNDWMNHKSDVANIVSRYQNEFSESDVKSIRGNDNAVTLGMANIASSIIDSIRYQLLISIGIALLVNLVFAAGNARDINKDYSILAADNTNYKKEIERTQHWLTSGTSVLTAVSGAVSVGVALVGSVSLLSPSLVGGFIIAGLLSLLGCIILGIINHGYGAKVVKTASAVNGNIVPVDPKYAANWEGFIAMQFALLITGTSLIILQVILS